MLAAAEELSFAVSRAASSLATGRVGRIAVLVSGPIAAWFNGAVLDAAYEVVRAEDHELVIYRIMDATQRTDFFARLPARRNADALVVASFALTARERERLDDLGMPIVYVNQRVPGSVSVSIDDVAGARDGARQLYHLGHRRLVYVGLRNRAGFSYSASDREKGFRAALVPTGARLLPSVRADSIDAGDAVVASLLSGAELPTAIMAESDELALSVLSALGATGLRVPADVSLLGFDDHQLAATLGLTTVAQPVAELGRRAAGLALQLAAGADPAEREIVLPTALTLRRTVARPPETGPPG